MKLGLLTDSLSTMTRDEALDTAAELGIDTVEIGLGGDHGGWSPAPHADVEKLLVDRGARQKLASDIDSRGLTLEAFNAAGNPLHPVQAERDDRILRSAIKLAEEFGIDTVVTMSGLPGSPGDSFPAWITTVWPPENVELLNYQWDKALKYWEGIATEAASRGVKIAVEMHANQLVYSVPSFLKLREHVGDTIGVNLDPSHLMWMGADPLAATEALAGTIHHVHAKDTRIESASSVTSRFETLPNELVDQRAWNFVSVGTGHPDGADFWAKFADKLLASGYDGPVSIENEDYSLDQRTSVASAVDTLRKAAIPA